MINQSFRNIIGAFILLVVSVFSLDAQKQLTINDAISIALKNNFDILVSENNLNIAKTNNTLGNAGMLPTVGLIGSGNYELNNSKQKLSSGSENNYPSLSTTALSAGIQLNWNLFDGGKMFVTKSKLNEIQSLGEIQYKDRVMQTLSELIAAYYDVVRQKQQLNAINEVLALNNERVIISKAGFNAGSLLKTDLLQSKIDMNITGENLINQQYTITAAMKTLSQLLGEKSGVKFEIPDTIPLGYSPDKAELLNKLNRSNTSILSFQKQLEIAQLSLKETHSAYLPTFNVKAGYYASQSDNSSGSVLKSSSTGPQVGGTLSIPIYNAGETKRKEKTAKIQLESAQYELDNIKLQVGIKLENTLTKFENQQKLLKIETENNELAKENIQISLERLKQGQTTSLEVHQAQEFYAQSCTRLINFRYNLKMAETTLKQLISEL